MKANVDLRELLLLSERSPPFGACELVAFPGKTVCLASETRAQARSASPTSWQGDCPGLCRLLPRQLLPCRLLPCQLLPLMKIEAAASRTL